MTPKLHLPTLHKPLLPPLPEEIRLLLNATYVASGGAEHMSLEEWRHLEQEVQTLENEYEQRQQ